MVAIMLSVAVSAEAAKKTELATVVFKTDIDCEGCSVKIMNVIPFQRGVKKVVVDVPVKQVTITYDPVKSSEEELVASLKRLDVKAVKAE